MKWLKYGLMMILVMPLWGCPSKAVPGKYNFDREHMVEVAERKGVSGRKLMMFRGLMNRVRLSFTLFQDGKLEFDGKMRGITGAKGQSTGYWRQNGDVVTLTITRLARGKRVQQVFLCRVQGKALSCKMNRSNMRMHFRRR